jgi:hypothetical protein
MARSVIVGGRVRSGNWDSRPGDVIDSVHGWAVGVMVAQFNCFGLDKFGIIIAF